MKKLLIAITLASMALNAMEEESKVSVRDRIRHIEELEKTLSPEKILPKEPLGKILVTKLSIIGNSKNPEEFTRTVDEIKDLIMRGTNVKYDRNIIYLATHTTPEIVTLLLERGADANASYTWAGATPLMFAAAIGNHVMVETLLKGGLLPLETIATPNSNTYFSELPTELIWLAKLYTNNRADPHITDNGGSNALDYAICGSIGEAEKLMARGSPALKLQAHYKTIQLLKFSASVKTKLQFPDWSNQS